MENPKINFIWNSVVSEVVGDKAVNEVRIKNVKTGEESLFQTDGVFIFIGHTPNTQLFNNQLDMENGFLKINERMHTSVEGIFAAGEAADPHFKQVVVSAGMGAAAAIEATRYLENSKK